MISVWSILLYELQSFLALGTRNWPLSDVGMATSSVAPCPMCSVPAQLLAQLEVTVREAQGLEEGIGRKFLMRWKGYSNYGGGNAGLEIQRTKGNFVCHLPSTCGWKYLIENQNLLDG